MLSATACGPQTEPSPAAPGAETTPSPVATPTPTPELTPEPRTSVPPVTPMPEVLPAPAEPIYKYVTEQPTGWFKTGQEANVVLYGTGFNESGGPTILNHPGKIATDGRHLIIADTRNNRVLIWNEIPIKNNELPDVVLGQPDFDSNIGRLGNNGMNWPMGVATDGKRLD